MLVARQNFWVGLLLFAVGVMFFTMLLDHQEIISFESRFYLFAMEMWRHGPSWFSTTYHQPYPDYPGTSTVIIYALSKMLGGLSRYTAILPSALVSAMTLTVTYLIGAKHSQRWGLAAVAFLLLTYSFISEARTISLDQYTTLITALCFYLAMSNTRIFYFIPLLLLGFAIRGPIGLVVPAGVLCVFYLIDRDFKAFFKLGFIAALLLMLASITLLLLAYREGGAEFVHEVIKMQVVGRLQEAKKLPWDFYFIESFVAYAMVYPLAILLALGVAKIPTADKQFLKKLMGWALIVIIGLSIPTNKKVRYILPFAPALALMCGYLFTVSREYKYLYILQRMVYALCVFFPTVCLMLLLIIRNTHAEFELGYSELMAFYVVMQFAVLFAHFNRKHSEMIGLCAASICFVSACLAIVEPINFQLNRTHDFVQTVESMRQRAQAQLAFYHEGKDGLVIKYLANMTTDDQPLFVSESDDLLKFQRNVFFATSSRHFDAISPQAKEHLEIVSMGKIGREPFVVFKTKQV